MRTPRALHASQYGHDFAPCSKRGRCQVCHRSAARRRARRDGVLERVRPLFCRNGHPLVAGNLRGGKRAARRECASCHRDREKRRRGKNLERLRAVARAYAQSHKAEAHARSLRWRRANREHVNRYSNLSAKRRHIARVREADLYLQALMADPCSYCGGPGGHIDHIVPVARGGPNEITNLAAICARCNSRKRTRSLLEFLVYRRVA
jgi:5-methylcytosine-specific restriction endonuclease McrA